MTEAEIEKVARAIYVTRPDGGWTTKLTGTTGTSDDWTKVFVPDSWEDAGQDARDHCLIEAKAAIAAMPSCNCTTLTQILHHSADQLTR
jgi:hypothetical protein